MDSTSTAAAQPGRFLRADAGHLAPAALKLAEPTSTSNDGRSTNPSWNWRGALPKLDLSLDEPTMTFLPEESRMKYSPVVWAGVQYSDVSDFSLVVQCIHVGPWLEIHKNLVLYTLDALRLADGPMTEIRDLSKQWAEWDILSSLGNYQSVVNILFGYLNNKTSSKAGHPVRTQISKQLSQDVCAVQRQLVCLLRDEQTYRRFLACHGNLAQQLLDLIQDILDSTCESTSRPLLSKALIRLSRTSGLHPTCFALSGLEKVGQQVAAGGFGDICKGLVGHQSVAVKMMRLFRDADVQAALKDFGREALIWRQLSHPNLLPFFGLYYLDNRLCLVSPWMENGGIVEFLRSAPADTDRPSLILDVAMGLEYLHSEHIIHADLKGVSDPDLTSVLPLAKPNQSNILVTPSRRACIADFGLSSIADSMPAICFTHSTASTQRGTMRWQAPELLRGESVSNVSSDVYAFACVCYEILSGKIPFYEVPELAVIFKVAVEGVRPAKPVPWPETAAYHNLWELMQECWNAPGLRPAAADIVQRLVGPLIGAKSTQSGIDWDDMSSSRFRRSLLAARNGSLASPSPDSIPSSPLSPDQYTASPPTVSFDLPQATPKQRSGRFEFATVFQKSAESSPVPAEEEDENISRPRNFQHQVYVESDEGFRGLPPSWIASLHEAGCLDDEIAAIQPGRLAGSPRSGPHSPAAVRAVPHSIAHPTNGSSTRMPSASPQSSPVRSSGSSDSQDHHTPTTELADGDAEGPDYYLERKKYLDGDGYPLGGGHKQRYSNDAEEGDMHAVKAEHEEEGEETEKGAHRDIGWVPGLEDFIDETEHPRGSYCGLQESAEDGSGRVYAAALVPTAALHPPLVCACDIDDGQNGRRTLVALLPGGSHQPTDVERNCRLLRGLWCAQVLSIDALCVGLVEDSLWIRMELTERSLANVLSLDVVVSSVDELEPRVMARWANDMRLALDQHNIAHHELRSDNSLLNREGVLKPPDLSNAVCGTPETPLSMDPAGVVYWPAPEVRPGAYDPLKNRRVVCRRGDRRSRRTVAVTPERPHARPTRIPRLPAPVFRARSVAF